MALVKAETVNGFSHLPPFRQIAMMVGLAASVALGVYVALWSQTPNYSLLFGGLTDRDSAQVVEALQRANVVYKLDPGGSVLVPGSEVHQARMLLATQGLPNGGGTGFELLDRERSFGTSQFLENARFQRALEGELVRTIGSMRGVHGARVHLALPKRSVFVRSQTDASASVFVNLASGRNMDENRVASIVHLVASSVPYLEANNVTVINQHGDLLTAQQKSGDMGQTSTQFSYSRKLEKTYTKRIEDLLSPMVGIGGVRAQVSADIDFTVTERTQESYNPDVTVLRSEQTMEDRIDSGGGASGVPGSLSSQPPEIGTVEDNSVNSNSAVSNSTNSSTRSTRNFELDKTVSHTRLASGNIQRLSIAVLLDSKQVMDEDTGEVSRQPWTDAELERFNALVKEAVGFNEGRGDSVNVASVAFHQEPVPEALPEPGLLEQPWIWTVAKQVAGALGVLVLMFGVLKPVLRSLTDKGTAISNAAQVSAEAAQAFPADQVSLTGNAMQAQQLEAPGSSYEQQISGARNMVTQDPKLVAQVVKSWVANDA